MKVLYVAISYRTPTHARRFMECFENASTDTCVILVDNTEPERKVALGVEPQRAHLIHECPAPENLGYFGGARYGLSTPVARDFDATWTVISNVDLVFDPVQLAGVLSHYEPSNVGVIAPAITSTPAGETLNPFLATRPTRARMRAYKYIARSYVGYAAYSWLSDVVRRRRWRVRRSNAHSDERAIYAPHGAFMVFSREFFRRGGNLDHPPFLYSEEITVAEQARRLSLPVLFCPRISVIHEQHASISKLPSRRYHAYVAAALSYTADAYFR